jgi:murein DD-endopeptidase MepM/ murein hydrolase activator NlpD
MLQPLPGAVAVVLMVFPTMTMAASADTKQVPAKPRATESYEQQGYYQRAQARLGGQTSWAKAYQPEGGFDAIVVEGAATPVDMATARERVKKLIGDKFGDRFGRHKGIDIQFGAGERIVSSAGGVVEKVDNNPWGWGRYVVIRHDARRTSLYAHLSRVNVREGQKIAAGTLLGTCGNTGNAYGANGGYHLHFEFHLDGKAVDPLRHHPLGVQTVLAGAKGATSVEPYAIAEAATPTARPLSYASRW